MIFETMELTSTTKCNSCLKILTAPEKVFYALEKMSFVIVCSTDCMRNYVEGLTKKLGAE